MHAVMPVVRENALHSIVNIARNADTAGVSVIRAFDDRRAIGLKATHRGRLKARCADSESRFLAMKKFSWLPASRLIAARQKPVFCANRVRLIRGGILGRAIHRRSRWTSHAHLLALET